MSYIINILNNYLFKILLENIYDGWDDQQQDGTRDHQVHPPCSWDYLLHYAWQQLQQPRLPAAAKQSARTFSFINLFSNADNDQANLQYRMMLL